MKFIETLFNAFFRGLSWILRIEPTTRGVAQLNKERQEQLDVTLTYPCVKILERTDAQERIRIVQKGEDFGAVIDFYDPSSGWHPSHLVEGGIVYDSLEATEAKIRKVVGWLDQQETR